MRLFLNLFSSIFISVTCALDSQVLSNKELLIKEFIKDNNDEAIALIEKIVNINSGTLNIEGNREVGEILQKELDALNFKTYWITYDDSVKRSGHLFAEMRGGKGKKIIMIGHLDTVFEVDHPFQEFTAQGTKAFGPGIGDMKSGDVSLLYIMKALAHIGALSKMDISLIFIGDEEKMGDRPSIVRKELIDAAKWADIGLGFESANGMNSGTVARRSASSWTITATGIQGHSSLVFSDEVGYGAIFEVSRILNTFQKKLSKEKYLTFNPGIIVGGTNVSLSTLNAKGSAFGKTNVISQSAIVNGGIRAISDKQLEKAIYSMKKIVSKHLPGTSAKIEFKLGYPPMEPKKENYALLDKLSNINKALGYGPLKALDPSKRGAADISFVAPHVEAALAGLGPDGYALHSADEWLDISSLPITTTRAAILIYRLTR